MSSSTITRPIASLSACIAALRPQQWVKNVVLFAAPLFALAFDLATLGMVGIAFVLFSGVSSSFYLINDVLDVERDRAHPTKRNRPIAAGAVSIPVALAMAAGLLIGGLAGSMAINALFGVTVLGYAVLQVAYNLVLKHKTIADIMSISAGFVLRAVGGAAAAGLPVSGWFVLCVGLLALFLAIEKRKAELVHTTGSGRTVLQHYSREWLMRMESIVTPTALIVYALWTVEGADSEWMLATLPFVFYCVFKYQYLTEHQNAEAPEKLLLRSPHILVTVVLWAVTALVILLWVP